MINPIMMNGFFFFTPYIYVEHELFDRRLEGRLPLGRLSVVR